MAIQFMVPDIQRGSAPVVAPGSESDAAASPEYPPHLTECRLRLRHMEQYECHDHSVIGSRVEGQFGRIGDDPGIAGWYASQHSLGPVRSNDEGRWGGAVNRRQQGSHATAKIENPFRSVKR